MHWELIMAVVLWRISPPIVVVSFFNAFHSFLNEVFILIFKESKKNHTPANELIVENHPKKKGWIEVSASGAVVPQSRPRILPASFASANRVITSIQLDNFSE